MKVQARCAGDSWVRKMKATFQSMSLEQSCQESGVFNIYQANVRGSVSPFSFFSSGYPSCESFLSMSPLPTSNQEDMTIDFLRDKEEDGIKLVSKMNRENKENPKKRQKRKHQKS